jgi:hypothetical protein
MLSWLFLENKGADTLKKVPVELHLCRAFDLMSFSDKIACIGNDFAIPTFSRRIRVKHGRNNFFSLLGVKPGIHITTLGKTPSSLQEEVPLNFSSLATKSLFLYPKARARVGSRSVLEVRFPVSKVILIGICFGPTPAIRLAGPAELVMKSDDSSVVCRGPGCLGKRVSHFSCEVLRRLPRLVSEEERRESRDGSSLAGLGCCFSLFFFLLLCGLLSLFFCLVF